MVERAEVGSVLAQIRASRAQMQPLPMPLVQNTLSGQGVESRDGMPVKEAPPFSSLLKQAIDNVNGHQQTANHLRERYELGDPDVDIVNVMIAAQKASISFEAMSQVRNRLVSAYQEVMRMPI